MALRKIVKDGDPVLRKISRPIEKFDDRLKELVEDMFDTMYEANGVGLAGPQIGLLRRVVVIDTGEPGEKLALVNPVIMEMEGEQCEIEGCLSVPKKNGYVFRPAKTTVKAQNTDGEWFEVVGENLLSRALCHEIDHLDGHLFTDKVVPDSVAEEYIKKENKKK